MSTTLRLFALIALTALLSQCGQDLNGSKREDSEDPQQDPDSADGNPSKEPPEYRYRFRNLVNGIPCDTGEHVFTDKLEYCRALIDDQLNRDCARTARKEEFEELCQDVAFEWPE